MGQLARLKRVRIAFRLANMIAVIMIFAVGLLAWWSYTNIATVSLARADSQAAELVQAVARSVVGNMFLEHADRPERIKQRIARAVEPFGEHTDIRGIVVANHEGVVIAASGRQYKPGQRIDRDSHPACQVCHGAPTVPIEADGLLATQISREGDLIRAVGPIYNKEGCASAACHVHDASHSVLGVVCVEQSIAPVMEGLAHARNRLILVTIIVSMIGPGLAFLLLQRWLDQPVRRLIAGMEEVAQGNLEETALPAMQGELGEVADAFNQMKERLAISQKQLVRSEKMASLGKIAAGVAHEINNPLTGILTYAEDLIDESDESNDKLEDYRVIHRETLRCRKIVRNLLDFAKRTEHQAQLLDINQILCRTTELVQRLASFRNVTLFKDLQEDLPRINGDPGQLQQVFLNFLVNSAEAMQEGGEIRIRTRMRRDGQGLVVTVTDNGAGIPSEVVDHIFEPFFSTKGGKTTGLGLSVSWGIIEQHHGRIEVQSELGVGTTFRVHLPVADAPAPASKGKGQ